MIYRALKLQYRLTEFCTEFKDKLTSDWLTEQDWEQLYIIKRILKYFHDITLYLEDTPEQEHHGAMWEALPLVKFILEQLEAAKRTYPISSYPTIAQSVNLA